VLLTINNVNNVNNVSDEKSYLIHNILKRNLEVPSETEVSCT
jgi:hypothetical protein